MGYYIAPASQILQNHRGAGWKGGLWQPCLVRAGGGGWRGGLPTSGNHAWSWVNNFFVLKSGGRFYFGGPSVASGAFIIYGGMTKHAKDTSLHAYVQHG